MIVDNSGRKMRGELAKLGCVEIGDGPVIHLVPRPMNEIVAASRERGRRGVATR